MSSSPIAKAASGVLIFASILSSAAAEAATIDLTGILSGGVKISALGVGASGTYGETFVASGTTLDGFSFWLGSRFSGSGALDLRGYIGTWNGSFVGSILYESATVTMNAAGTLQRFSFSPNLTLNQGQQYVAFLSISNLPVQSQSSFTMPYSTTDVYGGGNFVAFGSNTNFALLTQTAWSCAGRSSCGDVAFEATFDASPVPNPIAGAGLPGLIVLATGLLGWWRRKRKLDAAL